MPTTDRPARGSTTSSRRVARVTSAWALVAVLCAMGLSVGSASSAVAAPSAASGACTTAEGVTVIVDFQELGGGTDVYCAPNAPGSGLAALNEAGIPYRTALRAGGFVCQIDGKPASDPCVFESPVHAYWSYWVAPRGGDWCFSNLGAGGRKPPAGTVEGWSFSLNKTASKTPAPRVSPPPALAGVTPPPIPASHCTAPNRGVTPTTTAPAPQPTSPPATSAPGGSGGSTGSGSGSGSGGQPGRSSGGGTGSAKPGSPTKPGNQAKPGRPTGPGDAAAANGAADSKDATTPDGRPSKPRTAKPGTNADGTADEAGPKEPSDGTATDPEARPTASEEATARVADQRFQEELAAVNAGEDRRATGPADDGGSPVPAIFAAVAATALLGIGVRASRRNRAAS